MAYAANDMVLIALWILASAEDIRYISVVVCFVAFLVNDSYGFVSWRRMELRQARMQEMEGQDGEKEASALNERRSR